MSVTGTRHPSYKDVEDDYTKWRYTYIGGTKYKEEYLTAREGEDDFASRRDMSYVPAYAKEAVLEISRAIHQRLNRVTRTGTTTGTYLKVVKGQLGGVDRLNSTMNAFISRMIVDEMTFMGRVGVYVDNIQPEGNTKADIKDSDHPYFYRYKAEDIFDWAYQPNDPSRLRYVVLREAVENFDPETGLRAASTKRFRHVYQDENGSVFVQFYSENGEKVDQNGQPSDSPIALEISRIPFAFADLGMSLLQDVADHQIALMTLASMDMSYAVKSNIPFYTEQRNMLSSDVFSRMNARLPKDENGDPIDPELLTEDQRAKFLRDTNKIVVGATKGRYYAKDYERPSFIHPSPEPLRASMEKQDRISNEIRELVALNVQKVGMRFQSEESKKMDNRPLEAGLSYIGLTLQAFETELALIYAQYENAQPAVVRYPEYYNLLTETERRNAIREDRELMNAVPSRSFRLEMQRQIIRTRFEHILDPVDVALMEAEIIALDAPTGDPKELRLDVESGICSAEYASAVIGYPKGEAAKAQEEKAVRLNIATRLQSSAKDNEDERPDGATKAEKTVQEESNNA